MKTKYPALTLALLAAGCSQDDATKLEPNGSATSNQPGEATRLPLPVWFFGTIHHLPDNGGVWVVRTAGGTQYQPKGLPIEFQVDGLAVEVEARKHEQVMTTDALGQAIDIVQIRKRGSDSG